MTISIDDCVVASGPPTQGVPIPINFPVHVTSELRVVLFDGSFAVLNTDYTVQLAGDFSSANVTPLAGLVTKAAGQSLVIIRELPMTQPTAVSQANNILEREVQKAIDRAAMRDQWLALQTRRGFLRPMSEVDDAPYELPSRADRANKALGFDASGNLVTLGTITSLVELEEALDDIAAAVAAAQASATNSGNSALAAAGSATTATNQAVAAGNSASAAAGSAAAAQDAVDDAEAILDDIQDFVAGLGSFNVRSLTPLTPGQTVSNVSGGFNPAGCFVFIDGVLLRSGVDYTLANPNINWTLTPPAYGGEEPTIVEFNAVSVTDALIKTQNLADLVDKKLSRANLELTKRQALGDADASITPGSRVVALTAVLTTARTWAVPDTSAYNDGETIDVIDEVGGVTGVNTLTLQRTGTDTINGGTSVALVTTRGGFRLTRTSAGKWSYIVPAAVASVDGVPVGLTAPFDGPDVPARWLLRYGQAVSRTTYSLLLNAITKTTTARTVNANATLQDVAVDLTTFGLEGAKIEGTNIPPNTTIVSVTSTTIVMSNNAGAAASGVTIRIFPHGNGDGSTTFNVSDARGRVSMGRDNMGGTAANRVTSSGTGNPGLDAKRLGLGGGVDRHTLITAQLPVHNHGITDPGHSHSYVGGASAVGSGTAGAAGQASAAYFMGTQSATTGVTVNNAGSGEAHPNVQPSIVGNAIIFAGV